MVKPQYVGPLQIGLALISAAIGAAIIGTQAAAGNLRLNSPALVLGILFLGPPMIALTIKLAMWSIALLRTSAKMAELQTVKIHDSVAAWTAHTSEVQRLRCAYKALQADLICVRHRDLHTLHVCRHLPPDLRQTILELVRGPEHQRTLLNLSAAVAAAKVAWQASARGPVPPKQAQAPRQKRLGGVKELPDGCVVD